MKNKVLRSLTYCLLVFSTSALLRADRASDRRREIIPTGHQMHTPRHRMIAPFSISSGPTGYTPQQMRHAYGFDQLGTTGTGQIIAIVDAYGSPTIQADLDTFCAAFGIPSTTVAVYYPQGQPGADSGWAGETSLDVEWAHAIAPGATIILVASKSAATTDLLAAVDYAVSLGATQVSMSWGGSEFSTESTSDFHFNVPGVTFLASSGDSGAGAPYPASSPFVVGVGGTSLQLDSSANIISETAWSGSGGAMSAYEPVPSYQAGWWSGANRGVPDVAYDADPATGVPVYQTGAGWLQYGGTSMSTPQWAALFALANSLRSQPISSAPNLLYSLANTNYAGCFRDITSGSNGNPAGTSYDLVTGLGTPLANQLVLALAANSPLQVAAPVFNPAPGTYTSAQNVTITTATSGASIRYTTDGSTPTETNGTIYSSPVNISSSTTLKAIAYESSFTDSSVTSGLYTISSSPAASLNVLYNFTASNTGGINPLRGLIQGNDGNFYGTTTAGGSGNNGTFFKITATGVFSVLGTFNGSNGADPEASPVQGSDGNFYGTTTNGGSSNNGTIFMMTPAGVLTTLVSFSGTNGAHPLAGLMQGSDGNFYGTTSTGGSNNDGTVFKMTPTGVLTTLVSFNGANGADCRADLVQDSDGNFYGTTYSGGSNNSGTVFKMASTGILTTLFSFNAFNDDLQGTNPYTGLVQGSDGNFYGTTVNGGNGFGGTIFKITPAGTLTTLFSFPFLGNHYPVTKLVLGNDGNFYGTTSTGVLIGSGSSPIITYGSIFKATSAGILTTLVTFDVSNGNDSRCLVQGNDGNLYGMTYSGGTYTQGVIFQLIMPPPPPAATPVFSPAPGTYTSAQTVTITSATSSATIRYTTDGSTPTETNGTIYSSPVTISTTTNLQAIAYGTGLSDSTVTSGTYTISHPAPGWALRDFNGDGQPDILWHNGTTGDVAVWTMNGTTVTGASFIANIGAPWSIVAVGDFNQDGNADILWRNGTTGEIGVTLMSGTTITSYVGLGALDPSWTVAGLGDFNGDGQTDVFLDNTTTGEVGFWALNGTTNTGYISIGTLPSPWTIAGVGDFNSDGKSDLLWYNPTTGDLIVSLMDGATATDFQPVGNLPLPWTVAGLADFNGDGSVDILLRNATTGDTGLFLMNGTTPTSFVPLGNVPAPWQPSD